MKRDNIHVAYVGLSGFPIGLAAISRQKLLCKGLQHAGARVQVICDKPAFKGSTEVPQSGVFEGVPFHYATHPLKSNSFFIRNLIRVLSPINEFRLIWKLHRKDKFTHILVSNNNGFLSSVWYGFVAKVFGLSAILSIVELYEPQSTKSILKKINHFCFTRFALHFFDGYLPISKVISDFYQKFKTPSLYLPIMVDLDYISQIQPDAEPLSRPTFLFCGAAGYPNTIQFCIQSFEALNHPSGRLIIVAGGSEQEVSVVRKRIHESAKSASITHLMNLTDTELYALYKSSDALLIPLFDTIKDRARFPHKLGEYLASGKPVITSSIGEITFYLEDKKHALFAASGDTQAFSACMQFVAEHPEEAANIGKNGKAVCEQHFDYKKLGMLFYDFLKQH